MQFDNTIMAKLSKPIRNVTVRDVAMRAGCSPAVVSMIINRARSSSGASLEIVERVRRAAQELNYRPHFAGRSLARGSTQTIGVYVPHSPHAGLGFEYEGWVLRGFETACRARQFDMLVIGVAGDLPPRRCFDKFSERRIDGLLLLHVSHKTPWVGDLVGAHPNIVAINYYGSGSPTNLSTVNYDNEKATRLAVEHLVELGHRRIGYLGPCWEGASLEAAARMAGYRQTMAAAGLHIDPRWIVDYSSVGHACRADDPNRMDRSALLGAERLLQLHDDRPSAIVTYNDQMAVIIAMELSSQGIQPGKHISIVGIDDAYVGRVLRPRLTTIRQPLIAMGEKAAEIVIDSAVKRHDKRDYDEEEHEPVRYIAEPELIIRGSTAPFSRLAP